MLLSPRFFFCLSLISLLAGLVLFAAGFWQLLGPTPIGPPIVLFFCFLAVAVGRSQSFRPFAFTLWVAVFVSLAMFYPGIFGTWSGYKLSALIVPLIQIIMFGMGTQLTLGDFVRVFTMPKAVLIGIVLQFSIMPLVGKTLAVFFAPNNDVAAGMVLIGSCPGGVASNVMVFLAKGNVALSVTMTSVSTLLAPIMTPTMTKFLAGTYTNIDFMAMMITIMSMMGVVVQIKAE